MVRNTYSIEKRKKKVSLKEKKTITDFITYVGKKINKIKQFKFYAILFRTRDRKIHT